jgi:predicted molibdopterin-dependent oxidoreductase YjgC
VSAQTRLGDLVRVNGRTNEEVNEEWTCDRGKFGNYYVNDEGRLTTPLVRNAQGQLASASWEQALALVADKLRTITAEFGADAVAAIGSTRCTLEDNYLLGKLMRTLVGTNNLDHRMVAHGFEPMQSSIAELEQMKTIVSIGMKLDYDQPIVYLRVFKAVRKNGAEWIKANGFDDSSVADALRRGGEQATLLLPHHLPPAEIARARALCQQTGAKLNVLMPDCNSWGVAKAGVLPDLLPGMKTFAESVSHLESVLEHLAA